MTKEAKKSLLLDLGPSIKADMLVNPHILRLKCDGDENFGSLNLLTPNFQEKLLGLII